MPLSTTPSSPGSSPEPFPLVQELVETIIDFLHDNPPALRSCSLVCRDWVPRTRLHLVRGQVKINRWNSAHFLDILESPHLTIGTYVKELVFDGHKAAPEQKVTLSEDAVKCILQRGRHDTEDWIERLACQLPKLPHVVSLGIEHLNWTHFGGAVLSALATSFPSLGKLVALGCTFPSFTEIVDVFCAFPFASEIDVHESVTVSEAYIPKRQHIRSQPFDKLHLDLNFPRQSRYNLLHFLLLQEPVPIANFLHFYTYPPQREADTGFLNDIVDYIRACGSELEILKLRFPFSPSLDIAADLASRLDLRPCNRLQKAIISGEDEMKGEPFFATIAWPILSKISSSHLTEIIIIANELSYWVEEQLVDFTAATSFFADRSAEVRAGSEKHTVQVKLYGYKQEEATAFQHCLRANVPELYDLEMSAPHAHLTYFERMMQNVSVKQSPDTIIHNVVAEIDSGLLQGIFRWE